MCLADGVDGKHHISTKVIVLSLNEDMVVAAVLKMNYKLTVRFVVFYHQPLYPEPHPNLMGSSFVLCPSYCQFLRNPAKRQTNKCTELK